MEKEWYKSTTIWGSILTFAGFILASVFGYTIIGTDEMKTLTDNLVKLAEAASAIVGVILVIVGRIKAGKQIKSLKNSNMELQLRASKAEVALMVDTSDKECRRKRNPHDISGEPKDAAFGDFFLNIFAKVFGTSNVLWAAVEFYTTEAGKEFFEAMKVFIEAMKKAAASEKGKTLIDEVKKALG